MLNKSMRLTWILIGLALLTLLVGIFMLSQLPTEEEAEEPAFVVLPQLKQSDAPAEVSIPLVPAEPGSEQWCEQMMHKPDAQWQDEDARLFAANCLFD